MCITLTLAELIASKESWQKLLAAELPIKTAYWIGKKYRKIEPEMVDYEKKHNELVQKYGKPIEDRNLAPGMYAIEARERKLGLSASSLVEIGSFYLAACI